MKVYNGLLDVNSFVILGSHVFNSPDTIETNKKKIDSGEMITIYTKDTDRTGYTDVVETKILVQGDYHLGQKEDAKVIEDGKQRAEREAEERRERARQEEENSKGEDSDVEEDTEDTTEADVEEVQQETL